MYGHVISGGALASMHPASTWLTGAKVENIAVYDMTGILGAMVFFDVC